MARKAPAYYPADAIMAAARVAGTGNPATLRGIINALSLHAWGNTAEDKARLEACRYLLAADRAGRTVMQARDEMRALRRIDPEMFE